MYTHILTRLLLNIKNFLKAVSSISQIQNTKNKTEDSITIPTVCTNIPTSGSGGLSPIARSEAGVCIIKHCM